VPDAENGRLLAGKAGTGIVVSSRVRLARTLAAFDPLFANETRVGSSS
jgi:hypothetical protein